MPTLRLRVPKRFYDWIQDTDLDQVAPERASAFQKIEAVEPRKDGSRHVPNLTLDEVDAIRESAEWFENACSDDAAHGEMSAMAELNASRALMRACDAYTEASQ